MSKVKTSYSVKEVKAVLKEHGYYFARAGKHQIWELIESNPNCTNQSYALTTSKDPVRTGTMLGLIHFLGYSNFQDFQDRK